jgi:hypothetical protein
MGTFTNILISDSSMSSVCDKVPSSESSAATVLKSVGLAGYAS